MIKRIVAPLLFALGIAIGAAGVAIAQNAQPHMQNALNALYTAQNELNAAATNKAGHRAKALEYVQGAIDETKYGIQAAGGTPN